MTEISSNSDEENSDKDNSNKENKYRTWIKKHSYNSYDQFNF